MRRLGAAVLACSLAACQSAPTPAPRPEAPPAASAPGPADETSAAPDPTPAEHASTDAAAAVVRDYYAAIDAGDYRRAYALWDRDGQASGQTYDQFAAGFTDTEGVHVDVQPPAAEEGAAGSVYVTLPVAVRARTAGGRDQRFAGTYTLRRVNDVPGATPAQFRWHIESASVKPV